VEPAPPPGLSMAERLAPPARHAFVHGGRTVYEWDQSLAEVNVYVPVPPGVRARDMFCDIEKAHLRFGLKGNPPFLDVSPGHGAGRVWAVHAREQRAAGRLAAPAALPALPRSQPRRLRSPPSWI
jgi:hypothetical protein